MVYKLDRWILGFNMASSAFIILAGISFLSALVLVVLALADLLLATVQFWPPPNSQSWQNKTFRGLFRGMFYGLVSASTIYLWQIGLPASPIAIIAGPALIALGFVIALFATGFLGWNNAFGAKEGLRTDGIFAYSRNPIYVATWFGLAGWAQVVPSPIILGTLCCWAFLYLMAVFLEERWLLREYGESFEIYCKQVRRFL